jgi:hypothetical protein
MSDKSRQKPMTVKRGVGEIQVLVGRAIAAYENDRATCRASSVIDPLKKAFDICITLRDRWKPD